MRDAKTRKNLKEIFCAQEIAKQFLRESEIFCISQKNYGGDFFDRLRKSF